MATLAAAVIPALLQAFGPAIGQKLFGEKKQRPELEKFETLTPQQSQLFETLFGGLQGQLPGAFSSLSDMLTGNQGFLEQLQAPALRQFQEQTVPSIAERFSGANAQRSSAFSQALGSAGAGLAESLGAQRAQLGAQSQQAGLQGLFSLLGLAGTPQFGMAVR